MQCFATGEIFGFGNLLGGMGCLAVIAGDFEAAIRFRRLNGDCTPGNGRKKDMKAGDPMK